MFDLDQLKQTALAWQQLVLGWLTSPQFYAQVAAIITAWFVARYVARALVARVPFFQAEPQEGRWVKFTRIAYSCRDLLQPLLLVLVLALASQAADKSVGSSWLIRAAQSLALMSLLYAAINRFLKHPLINAAARWIGIPVATIYAFGFMPQVIAFLDGAAFEAGNIRISLLVVLKAALFGGLLFWAGRVSSTAGQRVIRQQDSIDVQTRELAAKAFDLVVIGIAVLLLMNVLGMDMAVLAVFTGAVGVGLGFGLQQIASNFISGVIILLERSLKLGDYIELEDGKTGTLTALNMRSSTLETFDGKEINVPNERFITTRVTNWTHSDTRQRYEVSFTVAHDTDVRVVPALVEKAMAKVKGVLQKPEAPECSVKALDLQGVAFNVKFWVDGVDDGKNSYCSDVLMAIWVVLHTAGIGLARAPVPAIPTPAATGKKVKAKE